MTTVLLMFATFVGYLIAYHTYGKFLSQKIFKLTAAARPPSREHEDGIDFVPTRKGIIFGHHYTSIAGTGPIVGPAIGVIWGWLPALLWVFVGSIVMGAVHDFGALVVSLRTDGRSIAECSARYISPRTKFVLFLVVFFLLLIVIAIFGIVIGSVFARFPESVFPVWMEIPIAVALGWGIYKRKWNVAALTTIAVVLMYVTVVAGHYLPLKIPSTFGLPPTGMWVIVLLLYAFVASSLSVRTLLQPRDYINAWQLFIAMGLMVLGATAAGLNGKLNIVAPAVNLTPEGAPPIMPFLFITIACGAISGFHCLVASGTTSKQISNETDALFVGYGSMLLEGVLAVLVIVAVAAGIGIAYDTGDSVLTGVAAWNHHYASWAASKGLGSKITAVVIGSANMIAALGIPRELGIVIMGVFIASFAGTTLDTATRLQRYIIAELFGDMRIRFMTNRFAATAFAVLTAAALAFASGANGKGALILWPLFGAGNQLVAALALLVAANYLAQKGGYGYLVAAIPCAFMLAITIWSVIINEMSFVSQSLWLLAVVNAVFLLLAAWIAVEGIISLAATTRGGTADNRAT